MDLTKEKIEELNKKTFEDSEKEYNNFVSAFKEGDCFYCGKKLDCFDQESPCFHWLLMPSGIKKKHFNSFLKTFGCFRLMAYLRWVANQEAPFRNINDLKIESEESRVFETTIKYKDKEWNFCCNKSDLKGHGRFNFPHYHFNMSTDGKRFINFHDFHLRFDEEDLFKLRVISGENTNIKHSWPRGEGMQDLMDLPKELLIDSMKTSNDEAQAAFHISSMISAKPGETISGDDIQDIIDESKRTGKTFTSLARKKLKDTSIMTLVSPGEGVVEINKRRSRGDKKKDE